MFALGVGTIIAPVKVLSPEIVCALESVVKAPGPAIAITLVALPFDPPVPSP